MTKSGSGRDRVVEDIVVLLTLLYEARNKGYSNLTKTQVHKFLFASEQKMWKSRIRSTDFNFIKMPQGPWSQGIEDILESLEESGLVRISRVKTKQGDHAILTSLSRDGKAFVEAAIETMTNDTDSQVLNSLRMTIDEYGDFSSEELQEKSHMMRNLVTGKLIEDIPLRQYVLKPRSKAQASEILDVDADIEETLEILLDSDSKRGLERALKSARDRPLKVLTSLDDLEE